VASYVCVIRGKTGMSWIVGSSDLVGSKQGKYVFYGVLTGCVDVSIRYDMIDNTKSDAQKTCPSLFTSLILKNRSNCVDRSFTPDF
jgi:hypothetical protein